MSNMDKTSVSISPDKRGKMNNIINLMYLAYIDEEVTEAENNLVNDIARSYGLTEEEFNYCLEQCQKAIKDGKITIEVPKEENDRIIFLRNLVMGMMIDGKIDDSEMEFLQFITDKYGFKPQETIEYLMNTIAEEFGKANGDDEEEIDPEVLKEKIELGKEALAKHDIRAAFDYLLAPAHLDKEAFLLFVRIPTNEHWIHLLSEEQVDLLKELAQKGYAVSQFTLGRYYQVVEASYDEARDLFLAASKVGLIDANAALANMYRLGQLDGELDLEKYYQALQECCEKGSEMAFYIFFKAEILGQDGRDACPQEVVELTKKWLNGDESEDVQKVNPCTYEMLGLAYQVLDDWETAADYYLKSVRMGLVEAYPDYLILSCYNQDFELVDEEGYHKGIENGCQLGVPYCYYMRANLNKDRYDECEDEKEKEKLHKLIAEDLNMASRLGEGNAALQMGYHYYYGEYGFEENNDLAWSEFVGATGMNIGEAYGMLAQIVLDGNGPEEKLPSGFIAYCRLMGLRLGDDDQLIPLMVAFHSNGLGKYRNEIVKYYEPRYNALPDEEKVTYFGMNFVAVIDAAGKADLIEFDFEKETWDELCEIIDAKKLEPIRSGALKQIAKDAEIENNIVAWVDSEAESKGLEDNPYGDKIYPGVKGHLILTLEDENGEPLCFDDIYELEEVVEKLGCEVEKIYYDEFPDNDSCYDAYA